MIKITVDLYGTANKAAGWNRREIKPARETVTIADVLKIPTLKDGTTLFDLIAEGDLLKEKFGIFLSGRLLRHPVYLKTELGDGQEILILDFPFTLGGG